ncbi:MAG TPA: sigma-54-dependent Fis family transcriptional regulator [Chromobacteriaceae bacterium]|nr:sigma-54-dependent Fis family transcriptional regulator [Chromobacteriaceae bacterium]
MTTLHSLSLQEIRRRFFDDAPLPDGVIAPTILQSWQRCRGLGLPASGYHSQALEAAELSRRHEANADWLQLARPHLDTLFESVVDEGHVVIVADRHGVILDEMGHPTFLDKAERVSLRPGMDWGEEVRGTNAIGTALSRRETILVRGGEHYLERNRQLACVASPILDPFGQPVGAIDISGLPRKLGHPYGAAVEAAARLIEQRLFEVHSQQATTFLLHLDASQLATSRAARLAFDEDERLIAANRVAIALLGLDWTAIRQQHFADLFGETLSHWLHHAGTGIALLSHGAQRLSARALPPILPAATTSSRPRPTSANPATASPASAPAEDVSNLPASLLATGLKLLAADIPVLVLGETGTGKEKFAKALHQASTRAKGPLVAVNCAAIPDGLVEAELFGYEEGAFTGARRQGSRGRLREAHGGVLFLDEIGDMPLPLQARLLRVLQERVVTPLGGGPSHQVDIRLICATHRDLRQMVEQGSFRADLYYRLCHYPLRLPPLRQRGDVATIAQRLLERHGAPRRGIALTAPLAALFRRYHWPGNLRELDNLLMTLLALVDDHTQLGVEHLPETLREDMERRDTQRATRRDETDATATMLARFGGNASATARALGISRSTLYRRLGKTAER